MISEPAISLSTACPVCGGTEQEPKFKVPFPHPHRSPRQGFHLHEDLDVSAWTIARCKNCGLQFASPRPTPEEILGFYQEQLEPNEWEQEVYLGPERNNAFLPLVRGMTALTGKPGRVLEIGCAGGWLLSSARNEGWEVLGVEASPKFHKYATKVANLPVILGTVDDVQDTAFDVVIMLDVLEHMQDPVADLCKIRRLLAPGGYLIISTPNIDSVCARFYGVNWRQVVISHTVYWTHKSMKIALSKAGLTFIQIADPRYWHPNSDVQRTQKVREFVKWAARAFLRCTYVPLSKLSPAVTQLPSALTKGRISHDQFMYKVGEQPVLDDVMLVVAMRPRA